VIWRLGKGARSVRLLDRVREAIRMRHYSLGTEKVYVSWIRRFILFHDKRHPSEMGKHEVEAYLSYLAARRGVSPSTQNQALQALLFLYRYVLEIDLPWLDEVIRAKPRHRLPPTCWKWEQTSARFSSYWATRTSRPR
jgi:site-specific recombinase XerD